MVRFDMTTLLIEPPVAIWRVTPRLVSKIAQLLINMSRIARLLPSLNLMAADAEESRQLVTVICSQGAVGPHSSIPQTKTMQSSLQLTMSIPSAQTASFRLVYM